MKTAIIIFLLIGGILSSPYSIPVLPPDILENYVTGVISQSIKFDNLKKVAFPQTLADRFGWDNLVQTVSRVYDSLSEEDREKCGIYAGWYGPAGAIDLLGPQYGLPHAVSGHLTYHLWGSGETSWEVMIAVGTDYYQLKQIFRDVERKAVIINKYTNNTNIPVYVCRHPKMPATAIWSYVKIYN